MKGVLLGMGVKEGARVTDETMNGVEDAIGAAAAMVCFCEAIDVLAIIVEIFICEEGVGVPFPRYLKKMIPRQQTEIATTITPLTIYIMRLMLDLVVAGFVLVLRLSFIEVIKILLGHFMIMQQMNAFLCSLHHHSLFNQDSGSLS